MATSKLFTVAGTSSINGQFKARFATDPMRVKVLARTNHENICLVELDRPMLKMDAVLFLKELPEFQSAEQQAALDDFIEKNTPREPKPRGRKPAADKAAVEKAPAAKKKAAVESKPAVEVGPNGKPLSMSKDAIRKREARARAAAAKAAELENQPY